MKFLYSLKLISDICFFMTFATIITSFFGGLHLFISLPIFIITSVLTTYLSTYKWLKLFGLIPLIIIYYTIPLITINLIALIPPIIYLINSTFKKPTLNERIEYDGKIKVFLMIFGWCLLLLIPLTQLGYENTHIGIDVYTFAFLFLFTGIMLTRLSRHDLSVLNQPRFRLFNFYSLLLVIIIPIVMSIPLFIS